MRLLSAIWGRMWPSWNNFKGMQHPKDGSGRGARHGQGKIDKSSFVQLVGHWYFSDLGIIKFCFPNKLSP